MRIFVTGATGFVGSAVVNELLQAGHEVTGLARSDNGAAQLSAAGAQVHRGALEDLDSLRRGVEAADGVIHTAFIHDFSKFKENCEIDRGVVGALSAALAGSARPLIVTSGTALLAGPALATEERRAGASASLPRVASEEAVDAAAGQGVNVSALRLPPSVHGAGDHGFVPMLIKLARDKGVSAYIGEGANRWPAVHRLDAARLYRLALEYGSNPHRRWHAAAEEGVRFREIAEAIGRGLKLPVVSVAPEEAAAHFGWFAHFAAVDNLCSSAYTRRLVEWEPRQPGLLADIENAASGYFGD
ncbi:MAG: Aurachin B dehydrogenase [Herbaspirillum frisingense]|uniref:Aurachin B dehydrogenase n=1 Tax=Herbaspirillum frisingense TaxID=92645 RepID=A0A7V8FVW2_9BURK|nr:MAG: Aurachin B dehydrogenase [Herbaspirillum frisingense]